MSRLFNKGRNEVELAGYASDLKLDHRTHGEDFYSFVFTVNRTSGVTDDLFVVCPGIFVSSVDFNKKIAIVGTLRSRNDDSDGAKRVKIYVFVQGIVNIDESEPDVNNVLLDGVICKKPTYRGTSTGRTISDVILVTKWNNRNDYLPVVAWGRNANACKELEVGTRINVTGRIQSRNYRKYMEDGTMLEKTVYEVSVNTVEEVFEDE